MISERLRQAIREAGRTGRPQWRIAREVHMHPVTLSNLMTGARDVEVNDRRVVAIGQLLNVPPSECFAVQADSGTGDAA